jgi:predicted RNA binding protein YcfA (HicA-like mRNA interferase family)
MNYREVAKKLSRLGCEEISRRGGGSHRKWFNPVTQKATVIPDWNRNKAVDKTTIIYNSKIILL